MEKELLPGYTGELPYTYLILAPIPLRPYEKKNMAGKLLMIIFVHLYAYTSAYEQASKGVVISQDCSVCFGHFSPPIKDLSVLNSPQLVKQLPACLLCLASSFCMMDIRNSEIPLGTTYKLSVGARNTYLLAYLLVSASSWLTA